MKWIVIGLLLCSTAYAKKQLSKEENKIVDYYLRKMKIDIVLRISNVNHKIKVKDVIKTIIEIESAFKPNSKKYEKHLDDHSYGLMQVLCTTARDMNFKKQCDLLFQPWYNIYYGIRYFKYQLKRYNFNVIKAIAAYNAGRAKLDRTGQYLNQDYVDKFFKYSRKYWIFSFHASEEFVAFL